MSGREPVKRLEKAGWVLDHISSSHHVMKPDGMTISIPVHANRDIPKGTLNKLLKDGGLT